MVFKKPYGFLIKHFRLIHLILTGLYIFLAIKVNSLLKFYNDFILGTASKLDAISYITNYYLIAIILSIIICLIVYWLLRYKKKPRFLYLILIGFTLIIAVLINVAYGGLDTIYISVLETKTLRLYRDLLRILIVFQYISIAFVLVRGLGFDIKKFNFVQDLAELNLDISDEEEVELSLGSTNSLQRKVNRRIREFKYYYLENRIFIHVILIVLVILGISSCVVKNEVVDKEYQQGETFSTSEFQFQVLDSFVTKKSYDNKVIVSDGTSFVVVRLNLSSNNEKKEFNAGNLILKIEHESYASDVYYGSRFTDLGYVYKKQKIGTATTYLFIYRINDENVDKKMKIVYAEDKTINLSPINLDEVEGKKSYKLGEDIDLASSIFGKGHLKIENFEIAESFSYPYEYEVGGQIYTNQYTISSNNRAIIKLGIDASYPYDLENYTFLNQYAVLKYKINDQEYMADRFDNKTPGNEKNNLYLAVDKTLLQAQKIWFDIKIRNQQYIYTIK